MKRKALFVGVNAYEDEQIRNLDFSLSDAHALKTLFELFGFESDILENPSKSDVFHAVRQMTAGLGAGDLFFFYFAGHGWTTTSGKHLLFCSDDLYEDLRDDDAGISFDKLKRKTTGDYNRAFVLDACRSDFITGTRGGDTTTRDLRPIGELVKDAPAKSSLAVLRSCSQYEHALEIRSRKHGLFTLAMMEVLRTSKDCGSELLFGEALCDAVTDKMLCIAKAEGITAEQTPEFAKSGLAQVLIEGSRTAIPSMAMPTAGAQNFVVCPICGRHALITETFKCKICGKDYICSNHFSAEYNCCEACAEKKINTKKALKAYNDADYDLAYELIQKGDDACPEGQFVMAGLYGNGCRYLDEDSDKAVEWLRKAAEQGSADAQFELANHYHNGYSVGKNPSEAYNWYMKAARQGHVEAQDFVGWCYETGFGVDEDVDSAFIWYMRAAEQGWASAQCSVGRLYANREGIEEDAKEAVKWYRKAAEQGDDEAQYYLGECYYRGDGVEESEDEAIKWYRKAAEQGDDEAKKRVEEIEAKTRSGHPKWWSDAVAAKVRRIWQLGTWLKKDVAMRQKVLELLCREDQTHPEVQYHIGQLYDCGWMGEEKRLLARAWYEAAARGGHYMAAKELGMLHRHGDQGCEADERLSRRWYGKAYADAELAANAGDVRAMYELGRMFRYGYNFESKEEPKQGILWWNKAAENGEANAQYWLAEEYRRGEFTTVNRRKEVELLLASARSGNTRACKKLADYYENGIPGVLEANGEEAQRWRLKADEIEQSRMSAATAEIERLSI